MTSTSAQTQLYSVIYDDPKRGGGASHTLHRRSCADVARAGRRGGNPQPLAADTVDTALVEARHGGLPAGPDTDLGVVDVAPCVNRAAPDPSPAAAGGEVRGRQ